MGSFGGDRRRRTALTAVLLPVAGAWLGHGVEALRLNGAAGLWAAVSGPVHLYMLPAGGVLALAVAVLAVRGWLLWQELGRRLSRARTLLRRAWRGGAVELDAPPPPPSRGVPAGPLRWWPVLAIAQVALYVVQENVETVVAGGRAPGLAVLGGVHGPVVLVQLGVALALAGAVALVLRLLQRRARVAAGCERLVRALLLHRGRRPVVRRRGLLWVRPPHDRHGTQLWSRPPPLAAV
jgi:hypothetical protein